MVQTVSQQYKTSACNPNKYTGQQKVTKNIKQHKTTISTIATTTNSITTPCLNIKGKFAVNFDI